MGSPNAHRISIKYPLQGSLGEIWIDEMRVRNVLSVKFESGAQQLTRVTLVLFAQVEAEGVADIVHAPPP